MKEGKFEVRQFLVNLELLSIPNLERCHLNDSSDPAQTNLLRGAVCVFTDN